jgi:hypothetical protein
MRMGIRRFTRLTNAFSKKVENHAYQVALHFMQYNFARIHKSLRVTPAMEAGVSDHVWSLEEIAGLLDDRFGAQPMRVLDYHLAFLFILAYATFGAIVSSLIGLVVSSVLRVVTGGIKRDAILGAVGFPLAMVGLAMMPWPCHDETRLAQPPSHLFHLRG